MTTGVAHHILSRAVDITQQRFNGNDGEQQTYQIGGWTVFLILATVVLYLGAMSMVSC